METDSQIRQTVYDIPFVVMGLFFLAVAIAEYLMPEGSGANRLAVKIISGGQISFALIVVFFSRGASIFRHWVPVSFFCLLFWLCFSGIIRSENVNDTLYLWSLYFYWYSLFIFFYSRSLLHPEHVQSFLVIAAFSLLVWVIALMHSTTLIVKNMYMPAFGMRQNYIGYYIIALFPYVLLLKKKSLKIIAISLITFGAIYSLKRGAVLALALMGVSSSFLYVVLLTKRKQIFRDVLGLLILWIIAVSVVLVFVRANNKIVEHRFSQGTNREEVYRRAFDAIEKAELYELIIGQGDRKAQTKIGVYTHDDWLFLLYDYGVVGVLLMLNIYVSLLCLLRKLCKMKSPLSLPLASSIIIMLCVQQYSIGLYLKTFGFITGSIGLVVGLYFSDQSTVAKKNGIYDAH